MIHVHNVLEFDYEEIIKNDIYLYETPDDFEFDTNLVIKFLESKGLKCEVHPDFDWQVVLCSENGEIMHNHYYGIEWLMRNDTSDKAAGIQKGEFLKWLETQGVKSIEYKNIL
jgi:hypothetical protein